MPQVSINKAYAVDLYEYERGWGSRLDETIYFDTEEEARTWALNYNEKHNNLPYVPDWYILAEYRGRVK